MATSTSFVVDESPAPSSTVRAADPFEFN